MDLQYSLNSVETWCFNIAKLLHPSGLNFSVIKKSHSLLPASKNVLFFTAMVYFFLEEIYLPHIHLDMKSTDFIVRKLLNTTNAVRFCIVMFSWQPFLSLLICQFIFSQQVEIQTEQCTKYSHTVLNRNHSPMNDLVPCRRKE